MSSIAQNNDATASFSVRRHIVYPAAITFTVILFAAYLLFLLMDFNVTETRDFITYTYNGHTDVSTYNYKVGREFSLDLVQLFGIALFSLSFAALSLVHRLSLSGAFKRLIHFIGTLISFYLFVLVLSGSVTDGGFAAAIGITMAVGLVYFILLGLKKLVKRSIPMPKCRGMGFITKYLPPAFVIFAAASLIFMTLAMVINVQLTLNLDGPNYPYDDRIAITTYETVITPIAPTLQNYFRYLASAAVITLSLSLLATKLSAVLKALLIFIINGAAFSLIWLVQLDFFKELHNALLYASVGYIALYLIALITLGVISFVRKRSREDEGEYENQFLRAGKARIKKDSEGNED